MNTVRAAILVAAAVLLAAACSSVTAPNTKGCDTTSWTC